MCEKTIFRKEIGMLISVIFFIFSLFSTIPAHAEKMNMCKYVSKLRLDTSEQKSQIYGNVDTVHIIPVVDYSIKKLNHLYINKKSLNQISKCEIQKHFSGLLNLQIHNEMGSESPHAINPKNIAIVMNLGLIRSLSEKDTELVILSVSYHREGFHSLELVSEQCSAAFPLSVSGEDMLKALTRGIQTCLDKPYHLYATEGGM